MNPAKQNMIRIAVSMKVEVLVGFSSVRSEMVEGERSTAEIGWCYSYLLSFRRHMRRVISTC